jgi:tetratricopeptide (TPR) repeat protein
LLFLRATVLFEMQRFEDARTCLELLLNANAQSAYKDDAQYRISLSYFYQNDFKSVTTALKKYLADNPKGQYIIDAKYRLAFIKFQGKEVESAMEDLRKLVEEAPNDRTLGRCMLFWAMATTNGRSMKRLWKPLPTPFPRPKRMMS